MSFSLPDKGVAGNKPVGPEDVIEDNMVDFGEERKNISFLWPSKVEKCTLPLIA